MGVSVQTIAEKFGTTPNNIEVLLSRMGVKRGPAAPQDRERPSKRPRARESISERIAILLGQQPRHDAPHRDLSDDELKRYAGVDIEAPDEREDLYDFIMNHPKEGWDEYALRRLEGLKAFSKDLLGLELLPWQEACAYLMLGHPLTCTVAGRQSGKDFLLAAFVLWESITRPNSRTVLVSPAQRQSDELMERMLGFAARSDETYYSILPGSRERVTFRKNGSTVYALPATGFTRGLTEITRAVLNEVRDIPDDTFDDISPMLSRVGGSLHLYSTPLARVGPLFEAFENPAYASQQLPSSVNRHLDPAHLEREALRMSADSYRREYLGEFSDAAGLFFTSQSIDKSREAYDTREASEDGKVYGFGFDAARFRDSSVLSVLSRDTDGMLRLEAWRSWVDVPFVKQLAAIQYIHQVFQPQAFVVEAAGLSLGPIEQLEEAGIRVQRYVPTAAEKLKLYGHLKNLFEKERIRIPTSHAKLITELKLFEFKTSESGNVRLAGSEDDHADSLAFAAWGLRENLEPTIIAYDW